MCRLRSSAAWLVVMAVWVVSGCGTGQATPAATVEKMLRAYEDADKDAYLACFDGTPSEVEMLRASADVRVAAARFEKAFEEKFGRDAWTPAAGNLRPARFYSTEKELRELVEDIAFAIEGDRARAVAKGKARNFFKNDGRCRFVRKGGDWKIVAADIVTPGDDIREVTAVLEAMTEAFRVGIAELEKPDVKPAELLNRVTDDMTTRMRAVQKPG